MKYTNEEMYWMLVDCEAIPEEALSIIIQVLGDKPDTFKTVLSKTTKFKTFEELDEYYQVSEND